MDLFESNDSLVTARTLQSGNYTIDGINQDFYRLDVGPGDMTFVMTPRNGQNVNMELWNAQGQVIRTNFDPAGPTSVETVTHTATSNETYYLRIYQAAWPAAGQDNPSYALSVQVAAPAALGTSQYEPNNSLQQAKAIGSGTYQISGADQDFFRIDATPGTMRFTMTPTTGQNVNLELLDSNGNAIRANIDQNGPTGPETINFVATENATYYLRIYQAAWPNPGQTSPNYSLAIDLPRNTWSVPLDFGPVRDASIAVYDIDADGKDEIVVGTSKALDAQGNELRPAGLIVLEDNGTVKWTKTFAAWDQPDSRTGKLYNTTSVSTAPLFTDVNGDGQVDIVVGVGGDNRGDFGAVGQPGDRGGVYAVNGRDGSIIWFHQNGDKFGAGGPPDGRPDGVYGAPNVFDIDSDGVREIVYASWDHMIYVLDARTGKEEKVMDMHDTIGATPKFADLNRDGLFEIIQGADITQNLVAGVTESGGILHVINQIGTQTLPGWNSQVLNTTNADFRGYYNPQVIWSTPQLVDLDGDGSLEIIHGTGNYFKDARGDFVTVRDSGGNLRYTLATNGRPAASPLVVDINNDGRPEIMQTTLDGWVHAWTWNGQKLWDARPQALGVAPGTPLALNSTPIAVDLNNDGKLEILLAVGPQVAILDSDGKALYDPNARERIYNFYGGSLVAKDIDADGRLDILSGGTNAANDQAVIYRWENPFNVTSQNFKTGAYQGFQSLTNIDQFVDRFYQTILQRAPDPAGNNDWNDRLYTGVAAGADVARGFIFSQEFTNRNLPNDAYVNILYSAFFNRSADAGGFNNWMSAFASGATRAQVLDGFIFSQEFANLCAQFSIRPASSFGPDSGPSNDVLRGSPESDILRGGAGNDVITDNLSDVPRKPNEWQTYGQVYRLYGATLGRAPDAGGLVGWVDGLNKDPNNGGITLSQAAAGFVDSQEFKNRYSNLDNTGFVTLLYQNVLNRAPDVGGLADWKGQLDRGVSRASVVLGFSESAEYQNRTLPALVEYMRMQETRWTDLIEGGAGNDTLAGGRGADVYVFRAGQGGSDEIWNFDPWDELQFSGFGYSNSEQPLSRMTQQGANVVFNDQGQTITFTNTNLANFNYVRWNLS